MTLAAEGLLAKDARERQLEANESGKTEVYVTPFPDGGRAAGVDVLLVRVTTTKGSRNQIVNEHASVKRPSMPKRM
jgi:hypothetical protein